MFMSYTKYEYNDRFEYVGNGQTVPKDATSVRFHPSVIVINNNAFNGCKSLREVILNDGLREIGEYAFRDCIALQSINIPSTVTKIGLRAFSNCINLRDIVLSEGLTEIGDYAFTNCKALQSITISSTVDEIGHYAFSSCNILRHVVLNDGLKKIGNEAFQFCSALQNIIIPSTVTEIESEAFRDCTNLRDVALNVGIKRIRFGVFAGCTTLKSITLPSTVTEVDKLASKGCSRLREVALHDEEVQIEDKAFANCTLLERFSFPSLSNRLNYVIKAGHTDIEPKMDDIPAVEWRSGELVIPAIYGQIGDRVIANRLWRRLNDVVEVDKEKLNKVKGLISYYELKEATTLFELALWKAKIDQADDEINRDECRIGVPGPVKDTILQFLGYRYNVAIPPPRYEGWMPALL